MIAALTIGPEEVIAVVGLFCSIAAFFCALWIKGISSDIHDLVRTVGEHSERIAKLEARVDTLEGR